MTPAPTTAPTGKDLLAGLDPDAIRARLDAMEQERRALRALLRAAILRERAAARLKGVRDAR